MATQENAFARMRHRIDALTEAASSTQSATVIHDGTAQAAPQLLLYSKTLAQGDSLLWLAQSLAQQETATAQALVQMHMQIHTAAQDLRI